MTIGNQLSDLNPDGTSMGQTTADKVSFYGVTPVVQPTGSQTAVTAQSTTTAVNTLVVALRLALVNLGLIAGV